MEPITPKDPQKGFSLEELQSFVGGFIEPIVIGGAGDSREVLIVNENGLNEELPPNALATAFYGDLIVGNVVRCRLRYPGTEFERWD